MKIRQRYLIFTKKLALSTSDYKIADLLFLELISANLEETKNIQPTKHLRCILRFQKSEFGNEDGTQKG